MPDSTTTNLNLTLPEVGVSSNWASDLNANFTALDQSVLLTDTQTLTNKTLSDCDATTQNSADNSTKIATTAYVDAALGGKDALAELIDVDVSGVTDNKLLAYDSASQKFIDQTAAEAGVQPTIADGDLTIAKTNGLQAALDSKQPNIADGDLTIAKTNGLQSALDAKLDSSAHTKASLDVDHLITLSGVTDASDDLGTFTGSTIADSETVKGALQDLETAVETKHPTIDASARLNADLIHDGSVSNAEFGYLGGVTSDVQTQIDSKLNSADHTKASLDIDHLITLSGVADASDNLGTFTGSTIADNETIKGALQDLETALELAEETSDINLVYTQILGVTAGDATFGTFSGTTITDNRDAKEAFQELETAVETKLNSSDHTKASLDVDHLITLSGVSDASDDLGTFTGSTIADSSTIKGSLQALETEVETKQAAITSSARLNADLIHDGSVSNTEFGYLNGVTSSVQTQINTINTTITNLASVSEDDVVALSIALG